MAKTKKKQVGKWARGYKQTIHREKMYLVNKPEKKFTLNCSHKNTN